jgi:hypothetical protein
VKPVEVNPTAENPVPARRVESWRRCTTGITEPSVGESEPKADGS